MEAEKRNLTVFGPETDFDGELEYTDDLLITGKFHGNIKSKGALEIAKTAVCNVGKISVQSIVIFGTVIGNIEASERIEMCAGSKVCGDVTTARLRIAENVNFDGQVTMLDEIPAVDLFTVASKEYKQALVLKSDFID